jgi:hypothetical protein
VAGQKSIKAGTSLPRFGRFGPGGVAVGELSIKNMRPLEGFVNALLAAGALIGSAVVVYYLVRNWFLGSLTPENTDSLSTFILIAVILGIASSVTVYLYSCYPKGTKCRMIFGMVSALIIVVYSFSVLIASGFSSVLADLGLSLDMIYPALLMTYASVLLMFTVGGEYISSREEWLKKAKAAQKGQVSS